MTRKQKTQKKTPGSSPRRGKDAAYAGGGTGSGTGGRYDEKRDPPFPEGEPPYADHASMDFDASRQGADVSVPTTDSGVSNAGVDEFTTGGNSLGRNAGQSPSVRKKVRDSGRRPKKNA
jgi:hypothetical protein